MQTRAFENFCVCSGVNAPEGARVRRRLSTLRGTGAGFYEKDSTLGENSVQLEFLMILVSRCVCVSNGVLLRVCLIDA